MKKCKNCGAYWQDNRSTCLDCGAVLDNALTEEEEREVRETMSDALYDMAERTDDFYVSPKEKLFGILALAGAASGLVLMFLANEKYRKYKEYATMVATLQTLEKASSVGVLSFLFLLVTGCLFLFPQLMWTLETLRYRKFYNWDTTPSDTALRIRKILTYALFVGGMMGLLYGFWLYL